MLNESLRLERLKELVTRLEQVKIPLSVIYAKTIDKAIDELKENNMTILKQYEQMDKAQAYIFKLSVENKKLTRFLEQHTEFKNTLQ